MFWHTNINMVWRQPSYLSDELRRPAWHWSQTTTTTFCLINVSGCSTYSSPCPPSATERFLLQGQSFFARHCCLLYLHLLCRLKSHLFSLSFLIPLSLICTCSTLLIASLPVPPAPLKLRQYGALQIYYYYYYYSARAVTRHSGTLNVSCNTLKHFRVAFQNPNTRYSLAAHSTVTSVYKPNIINSVFHTNQSSMIMAVEVPTCENIEEVRSISINHVWQ